MKTFAVISEFNLFHRGHETLLQRIRRHFGEDTCIIAVMSGNYTQRGDIAFTDKFIRAEAAVQAGVNLVLELPFPFSASGADYFARAGVFIADALGGVDALAFGSECGDLARLQTIAERMTSPFFSAEIKRRTKTEKNKGYAKIQEECYASLYGDADLPIFNKPNNILAIQYVKALAAFHSPIRPFTVERPDDYHQEDPNMGISSSAIRHAISEQGPASVAALIPEGALAVYEAAMKDGLLPTTLDRLSSPILAALRLSPHKSRDDLANRLTSLAMGAETIQEVLSLASTKRYTNAHIRRSLWYHLFGVTSAELDAMPQYTQILAMDTIGQKKLSQCRRTAEISLLSKPADYRTLPKTAAEQAALSQRADSLYALASNPPRAGSYAVLEKPYRKI